MCDHNGMSVSQCGLVIHLEFPHIAASSDALISCDCCGKGVVEVKCPYKHRYTALPEYVAADDSCFELVEAEITLSHNHPYYYQVHTQMYVCDVVLRLRRLPV